MVVLKHWENIYCFPLLTFCNKILSPVSLTYPFTCGAGLRKGQRRLRPWEKKFTEKGRYLPLLTFEIGFHHALETQVL